MTETKPMSDARLLELQDMRTSIRRQIYAMYGASYEEDIADAVDEIDRLRSENERLTDKVNSAIVYANCRINGHSDSCNRETWRAMVAKLGERVKELPDSETYEHPEATSDHCTCRDNYCLGLCPYSMSREPTS